MLQLIGNKIDDGTFNLSSAILDLEAGSLSVQKKFGRGGGGPSHYRIFTASVGKRTFGPFTLAQNVV